MQTISIIQPDDCHVHLRDGPALAITVAHTARQFRRAIIMPNLVSPITTVSEAISYRERILSHVPEGISFDPLMTLYLTNNTSADEIKCVKENNHIIGAKLYPAGATTNSDDGIKNLESLYPLFQTMQTEDVPLLIHGEVTDPCVDVFDREAVFIDRHLSPLVERFPQLRIVLEHITTKQACQYIAEAPASVAATITAHHLLINRNSMFTHGINPHHYCLPILKHEQHRQALVAAATSGNPKFFLGTDSAPHEISTKQTACGCAGIYTAHAAIEFYTEIFEHANAINKLEKFTSVYGANFYQMSVNKGLLEITFKNWNIPASFLFMDGALIPFRAKQQLSWKAQVQ